MIYGKKDCQRTLRAQCTQCTCNSEREKEREKERERKREKERERELERERVGESERKRMIVSVYYTLCYASSDFSTTLCTTMQ